MIRSPLLLALFAAFALGQPPLVPVPTENTQPADARNTVLVFLPQHLFANDEYEGITRTFARQGIYFRTASPDTGVAVGMNRMIVMPDFALAGVRAEDFAGLVLIGGSGTMLHWDDSLLHQRCRDFASAGKVVAAIGIAPITLARAGLLKGRRASVFRDRYAIGFIREHGARYRFRGLETDGRIVTASDAEQAKPLALTVTRLLGRN
jgi:protease I